MANEYRLSFTASEIDNKLKEISELSTIIDANILTIDYDNLLAFDTNELVFEAATTRAILGQAMLGRMILG